MKDKDLPNLTIAIDTMGGDFAPKAVLEGADIACRKYKNIKFLFFGDEQEIQYYLQDLIELKKISQVIHAEKVISSDDKPVTALRNSKNSSMRLAIEAVKNKEANAVVSSGNTGALMAIAKVILGMIHEIDRPAIAAIIPNIKSQSIMLDLGANAECSSENLLQFAIMGNAFARIVLRINDPKIGVLNIGSEEAKGNDIVKAAINLIRLSHVPLNFYGSIEGNDISRGIVDVIVSDGFSGNISLKTAEGTAKFFQQFLKDAFNSSVMAKLGYLFAKRALKKVYNKLDPRRYNGAMLLGLNGIVVKSHGSSDALGFSNAISVAIELGLDDINDKITKEIASSKHIAAA